MIILKPPSLNNELPLIEFLFTSGSMSVGSNYAHDDRLGELYKRTSVLLIQLIAPPHLKKYIYICTVDIILKCGNDFFFHLF